MKRPLPTLPSLVICGILLCGTCTGETAVAKQEAAAASSGIATPTLDLDQTPFEVDSPRLAFSGMMGTDIPIFATIDRENKRLSGSLRYRKTGGELQLEGSFDAMRTFKLVEKLVELRGDPDQAKHTGTFTGVFDNAWTTLSGSWTSADGKRSHPFEMKRAAIFKTITSKVPATITYPQFTDPTLVHFNAEIARATRETYPEIASMVAFNIADLPVETPSDLERRSAINATRDVGVVYVDPTLLSLLAIETNYMGGAHGMTGYATLTLESNPGTGDSQGGVVPQVRLLKTADLIGNSSSVLKIIARFLVQDLMKQQASSVSRESVASFAADLAQDHLGVTSITPQGLVFHFEPYAMGCYAEGSYEVTVPYRVFARHLPATSPLRRFLKN